MKFTMNIIKPKIIEIKIQSFISFIEIAVLISGYLMICSQTLSTIFFFLVMKQINFFMICCMFQSFLILSTDHVKMSKQIDPFVKYETKRYIHILLCDLVLSNLSHSSAAI